MFSNLLSCGLAILAALSVLAGPAGALPTTTATPLEAPDDKNTTAVGAAAAGRFTWYNTGLGACGWANTDGELVVALSHLTFDPHTPGGNPNHNALCGRRLRASYAGRSVDVTVVDRCPSCAADDLDLSPAAFQRLAGLDVGVVYGTWEWI